MRGCQAKESYIHYGTIYYIFVFKDSNVTPIFPIGLALLVLFCYLIGCYDANEAKIKPVKNEYSTGYTKDYWKKERLVIGQFSWHTVFCFYNLA